MKPTDPKQDLRNRLKKLEVENFERKNRYLDILEKCPDEDIFKSTLLFNTAALDSYIAQSKNQAHESFIMAKKICYVGFVIIGAGILIGFITPFIEELSNSYISIVATGSGILTELIAATIFVFYSKTLQQFNSTLNKIAEAQKFSLELIDKQEIVATNQTSTKRNEIKKIK